MIGALSIRARLLLFHAIVGAAVLLMAAAAYASFRSLDFYFARVSWSYMQLSEMTELSARANRYSEQIAELLLVGAAERTDFEGARADFQEDIDDLRRLIDGEVELLLSRTEPNDEVLERERLDRIAALFAETNEAVERLYAMREAGRQEEAVQLWRSEIENRLDAELEQLVAAGVADEVGEVEQADQSFLQTWNTLTMLIAGALLVGLAASSVSGFLLYRSLTRPIQRLADAASALGKGDLSHRVGDLGRDEFGLLAARFDAMAAQLHEQQGQLLAARSHLEAQVAQRTAELEKAIGALRRLDQQRVQFLGDISHQLRTPLTVLRGEAEVTLRGATTDSGYRETLDRIVEQSSEMGRLIDDLLLLAHTESDAVPFEQEEMDLSGIVSEAVRDAEVLSRSRAVTIDAAPPPSAVQVRGDRQRLKQAILIVLDNAVKYSAVGATVAIGWRAVGGAASIEVRNRGAAIAPEDLPHVFDRFFRGRGPAARGSGLGLPIAKWIVEKHAGSIALSSGADGLTEARIALPLANAAVAG